MNCVNEPAPGRRSAGSLEFATFREREVGTNALFGRVIHGTRKGNRSRRRVDP